ncbi:FAD/NAD(P)-binding domain-containing protein [Clavulina sp. PMI_390]|nr:FAD/NAD(P)-binding domain-containing protein [Clavulina sp. PMI_390]
MLSPILAYLAILGFWVASAKSLIYTDPKSIVSKTYDFIIVGAGTGGAVVGGRLSENSAFRVLVIEAGPLPDNIDAVNIPLEAVQDSPDLFYNWNYTLAPNPYTNNRALSYQKGMVGGGSSSINYCIWNRGSEEDWNKFSRVTGDPGWSWNSIVRYFNKAEHIVPPTSALNQVGASTPSALGTAGPIKMSLPNYNLSFNTQIFEIPGTPGYPDIPLNKDYNDGTPLGLSQLVATIGGGVRAQSMDYMGNATIAARPNLDLLINTRVTELTFAKTSRLVKGPIVTGLMVQQTLNGPLFNFSARKEVILSAGVVATPQLLQVSGIGNSTLLRAHGIAARVDNPNVGANLRDHPWIANNFYYNGTSFDSMSNNPNIASAQVALYMANHTGMLSTSPVSGIMYGRAPYKTGILNAKNDPTAGPNTPHYEIIFGRTLSRSG